MRDLNILHSFLEKTLGLHFKQYKFWYSSKGSRRSWNTFRLFLNTCRLHIAHVRRRKGPFLVCFSYARKDVLKTLLALHTLYNKPFLFLTNESKCVKRRPTANSLLIMLILELLFNYWRQDKSSIIWKIPKDKK